ncbi:MAG: helix-turn-helix domain-containing protein, partial [Chloroflexota bacterium]
MVDTKADLILHPIRIRIITELLRAEMSPQQLAKLLSDVPQATLYRHINKLEDANILEVISETPIRGTVEKVYGVVAGASRLSPDDIKTMSAEEHLHYFMTFAASLIGDFTRFIEQVEPDDPSVLSGAMQYSKALFYLSDDEALEINKAIAEMAQKAYEN